MAGVVCSNCGADNPPGARFCISCGTPTTQTCPHCSAANPGSANFCNQCGLKIGSAATPPHVVTPERTGGERRHIVILFSDVVGSSTIANNLDPEEWRELLADYQSATDQAIERFGGHVARFIGDGVLAYFGWPMSHENDGERAVRSAVAILERMAERNQVAQRRGKPLLNVRIALHLGEVVLSPSGEVYGDAPNVAARLQASAEPDTILITEPVYRLVRQHVIAEDLGDQLMKGFATPTHVYRVVELADVGRGEVRSVRPDTVPFVGRTQELDTLTQRWVSALHGQGQLVLIEGEPGIGKSRLLREFQARLSGQDHYWLEGGCSEFFVNTPFFPVVRFLGSLFSASNLHPSPDDMARLRHALAAVGIETDETVSLIGELIGVPPVAAAAADQQTVAQNRRALLTALVAWIVALAQRKPTVIALEDAQWADPSTLELISAICEQIGASQILIVMTARQMPKLTHRATVSECRIGVGRLRNEHVLEIARAVIGTLSPDKRDSDAEIILDVANRAEGVPLFAEEVARLVAARDAEGRETRVPVGLIILLSARLDQLGAAKEIAQVAAVIGHEFSYDLIRAVVSVSDRRLASLLAALVDAKVVVETGTAPTSSYLFRHRLVQDAAYEGLLRSERRELHRRVADVITKQFPELAEARPETLARHWASAGEFQRAVDAWLVTAQKAMARGAYEEARGAYYEALDNLTQQDGPRGDARELQIRRSLVIVLQMTRGYSAAETMEAERQARVLVEAIGDPRKALARIGSEWAALSSAAKYAEAGALADQFMALATSQGASDALAQAHMIQMTSRYRRGEFLIAEAAFRNGKPFFADQRFIRYPGSVPQAYGNASRNAWIVGRIREARERVAYALATTRDLKMPYDIAFAEYMAAIMHIVFHEPEQAKDLATRSLQLSEEHRFPQFAAISKVVLGRAQAELQRASEGVGLIEQGIAGMSQTGSRVAMTLYLGWLAEAQNLAGEMGKALDTIDRALTINPEELFFLPELLRIRGDIRGATNRRDLAEADLREAIAKSAAMGARMYQLRSAISLFRLLDGERDTREQLAAICASLIGERAAELDDAAGLLSGG